MTYILVPVISVAIVLLAGLTLRFVEPDFFYSLRAAVNKVLVTKTFIDYLENRITSTRTFPSLLVQDFRLTTSHYDKQDVLQRVNKIRELYRLLVRKSPVGNLLSERKPHVVISELAHLVAGLGKTVKPSDGPRHSTVDASSLLAFIGNDIRESQGLPPLSNPGQAEAWLSANPINIEQVIEILIAAVFGLTYRQPSQDTSFAESAVDMAADTVSASPSEAASIEAVSIRTGEQAVEESVAQESPVVATRKDDVRPEEAAAAVAPEQEGRERAVAPPAIEDDSRPEAQAAGMGEAFAAAWQGDGVGVGSVVEEGSEPFVETAAGEIYEPVIRVFISYSHRDRNFLFREGYLLDYMSGLMSEGIEFWHDEKIAVGGKWDDEIKEKISSSHIALVLVSQFFLNSDYCLNVEIKRFLVEAELNGLIMMPIMLSSCEWERHEWLRERRFLPRDGETIEDNYTRRGRRDKLFKELLEHLRGHIENIRKGLRNPQIG